MAKRPIFIPFSERERLVREVSIEFAWHPGFAPTQKKKNIAALHAAAEAKGTSPLLEVSTKSERPLGQRLSAFNLKVRLGDGTSIPLESAFQGSKIFENGGPFQEIYRFSGSEARKDDRMRSSGAIKAFRFEVVDFPSEPKTAFYDWLYIGALASHRDELAELGTFSAFTDIEFNPEKSINCQARSCAIFVSLLRKGLLDQAISSPAKFIETVSKDSSSQPYSDVLHQARLL